MFSELLVGYLSCKLPSYRVFLLLPFPMSICLVLAVSSSWVATLLPVHCRSMMLISVFAMFGGYMNRNFFINCSVFSWLKFPAGFLKVRIKMIHHQWNKYGLWKNTVKSQIKWAKSTLSFLAGVTFRIMETAFRVAIKYSTGSPSFIFIVGCITTNRRTPVQLSNN